MKISRQMLILIVAGLMTGLLLGAMDQTIVATAGPTIISDLGGLSLYAWVFSAYILTQTVSMPVFGKLSDLYGRRRFFLLGLVIFMAGSILSGAAQNIEELIVFRAIQGIGSGAFFPVAVAVIGVVFPPNQRGRVQGIFSGVFGVAAVLGPFAGSFLVQAINWRWIFYINLPLGVSSLILIFLSLRESRAEGARPSVDWLGISTLTGWIVLLILGFLDGGSTFPWYSWQEVSLFSGSGVILAAFLLIERRAKEPILPLGLFKNRTISSASAVSFLRGIMLLGVVTFVPLLIQAGLNGGVDDGRNVLNALLVPMIVGSFIGGNMATKAGYRVLTFTGMLLMTVGAYLLTLFGTSFVQLMESVAVLGFGIGITFPTVLLAIQYSVDRRQIGIASSLAQFMGNLGGTIGLSILAAVQTNIFAGKLSGILQSVPAPYRSQAAPFLGDPNLVGRILASPQALAQLLSKNPAATSVIPTLRNAFAQSMVPVFWAGLGISTIALASTLLISGSLKQQIAARTMLIAKNEPPEERPTIPSLGPKQSAEKPSDAQS